MIRREATNYPLRQVFSTLALLACGEQWSIRVRLSRTRLRKQRLGCE